MDTLKQTACILNNASTNDLNHCFRLILCVNVICASIDFNNILLVTSWYLIG